MNHSFRILENCGCSQLRLRAFSLLELLTVIAVLGAMAVIGMPALMSSTSGSKITHAGNTLADLASLARQKSASGNAMVAMVLVNAQLESEKGQAVGIFEFGPERTWKQAGNWLRLPDGISVDMQSSPESIRKLVDANIALAGRPLGETDYSALVFYSDGRMCGNGSMAPSIRARSTVSVSSGNYYDLVFNAENSAFRISRP
jgi:prepilin-type N-terminal cleavage/methylation domain-containing protein